MKIENKAKRDRNSKNFWGGISMNTKKITRILILTFLFCGLAALPSIAATYNWQLAHHRSTEAEIHQDLLDFAEQVKEATNGQMVITIMGAGQLGSWEIAQERVSMGDFAMTVAPFATAVDKRLEVVTLPALVRDWNSVAKTFVMGSPFVNLILSWGEKQNLTILAPYPFYLGGIGFTKEIERPEDSSLRRGLKIRIPPAAAWRYMIEGLGYIATPIAWSDVFTSLQTRVIDGVSGGGAEAYTTSGFNDVLKSYLPANTHFEVWFVLVNTKQFNALPEDIKKALSDAALALQNKRLKEGPEEEEFWEKRMEEDGVKVYKLTEDQIKAYHKIIQDSCWEETRKIVGAEVFDQAIGLIE
jgi:TRAP-type C4-dicarboxylate transport system substrate-binding protein